MPDHKDLLDILRQTDGYLSGEELSRQLGVTRAAVWKKIEQLRQLEHPGRSFRFHSM